MSKISHGPPDELAVHTGFLLSWVAQAATNAYEQALQKFDLSAHHVGVLELLAAQQPVVQSRIGEQLDIFKPVMVRLINELEARGLVKRYPHPTDKRALEIHLLAKGEAMLAQIRLASTKADNAFFAALSLQERMQFDACLAKLSIQKKG